MFGRQKKKQNRNGQNQINVIRDELGGENILNNIGNEAANGLADFPNLLSNEANNAITAPDETLSHYAENDLNALLARKGTGKKQKEIPAEIIADGLEHFFENDLNNASLKKRGEDGTPAEIVKEGLGDYYENDLNKLALKKQPEKPKQKEKTKIRNKIKKKENKPNLINEPKGMLEKDPVDNRIQDDSLVLDGSLDGDNPRKLITNLINGTKEKAPGKPEKKGSKSSKKASAPKAAAPQERDEDLTRIDESLEPVQGWDFTAQKLPARKKQGFLSKLASWAAYYGGKTIGKIGGIIATIGKAIGGLFVKGPGTMGGTFKRLRGSSSFQPRGDRDLIPGWDGAKFDHEEGSEDDIDMDFRRIPELWSWPTAETPTEGKPEDRNSKPRDPVISVYISQGSKQYTVTDDGSTGHAGIGIEYSRYSAMSGRWQRYNLRFGYYIGGGGPSLTTKMAVSAYSNATIPGRIADEKGKQYDISRSFPAKPKQVSAVLRAAESFADRGGYNQYTRNCTTFAKEMIVDVAKIKGAEGLFAKDDIWLQKKQDAKLLGAGAFQPIFKAEMENGFDKWKNTDDLSYQNYGSKMTSREEYERYKDSLSLWSSHTTEGHSPNGTAENMRRTEGGKSGTIGMFESFENGVKSYREAPISVVIQQLVPLIRDLKTTLTSITPLDKLTAAGMTPELQELMRDLDGNKVLMDLTMLFPQQDQKLFESKTKQSDLVKGRTMMTDLIKKLNTLLFRYYRNDKRVQKKVLNVINVLNHGLNSIDKAYARTEENDLTGNRGELSSLLADFGKKEYGFTVNGKPLSLSASEYEAWLQIYKTPQKALEQAQRYYGLKQKHQSNQASEAEEAEFVKLDRVRNLELDFERSHRYMITKEKYNQQDVDYAFSLGKKERQGGVDSQMFEQQWNDRTMANMKNPNASAGGTYQMLIMRGVFGGMKDRFTGQIGDKYDMRTMLAWLNKDAAECVKNHPEEMKTIIRGLKHTTDKPDEEKLRTAFIDLLTRWLFQLFRSNKDPNQYRIMVSSLTSYNSDVMQESYQIITDVMKEEEN